MLSWRDQALVLLLGALALLMQGLLRAAVPPFFVPNLLLLITVFLGLARASHAAAVLCFALGLELDLYSARLLGPWAGAFVLVFGCLALVSKRLNVESFLAVGLMVLLSCFLSNLIFVLLFFEFSLSEMLPQLLASSREALITTAAAPPVFAGLNRLLPCDGRCRNTAARRQF
jgi:rod shape-determining protein MreD